MWLPPRLNRRGFAHLIGTAALAVCSCARALAQQPIEKGGQISGAEKSTKSVLLGMGADVLQGKGPISAINMYLNGFHFYADDIGRQVEAHHFCHHVNEDFFQCIIYDGNSVDARLIGIEYIVSERLFKSLPEDEKSLWHSHRHETTSGELVMPSIPAPVEHTAMATLASTYGKTWHTWQIDRNAALPIGIPQLMMGFTADGQLSPEMIARRDKELNVSTEQEHSARAGLVSAAAPVQPGADSWQSGQSLQLSINRVRFKGKQG